MDLLYKTEDGKVFSNKKDSIEYEDDLALKKAKYKSGDKVYADMSKGCDANIEEVTVISAYVVRYNKRGGGWNCRIGYWIKAPGHGYNDNYPESKLYQSLEEFAAAALKKKKSGRSN